MVKIPGFALLATEHPVTRAYIRAMIQSGRMPEKTLLIEPSGRSSMKRLPGPRGILRLWRDRHLRRGVREIMEIVNDWAEAAGYPAPGSEVPIARVLSKAGFSYERIIAADINDGNVLAWLQKERPIVALYVSGGIVRRPLLSIGTRFLHIHPGFLPLIRGSDCLLWSALVHRRLSASAFFMSERIDDGPVLERRWFELPRLAIPQYLMADRFIDARYKALILRLDPALRGAILESLLQKNDEVTNMKGDRHEEERPRFYHVPHPLVRNKAVSLFFVGREEVEFLERNESARSSGRRTLLFDLRIPLHLNYMQGTIGCLAVNSDCQPIVFLSGPHCARERIPQEVDVTAHFELIPRMNADLLCTTAEGAIPLYYRHRRVYFMHSLISVHAGYPAHSFEHFECILCAGPHHLAELSAILSRRRRHCMLVPCGYEPVDRVMAAASVRNESIPRVLFAPTWGPKNLLVRLGEEIVGNLLDDHCVTLRPHVRNLIEDGDTIRRIERRYKGHPRFRVDRSADSLPSLKDCDVVVTDWSGIAFEFALGRLKPVVFVDGPLKVNNDRWKEEFDLEPVEVRYRNRLGVIVGDAREIGIRVDELLETSEQWTERLMDARNELLFNPGSAVKRTAQALEILAQGGIPPGTVVV